MLTTAEKNNSKISLNSQETSPKKRELTLQELNNLRLNQLKDEYEHKKKREERVEQDDETTDYSRSLFLEDYKTDFYNHRELQKHKILSDQIYQALMAHGRKTNNLEVISLAVKLSSCGNYLKFIHDPKQNRLRLTEAYYCNSRICPICQWRRSLKWKKRLENAEPKLEKDFKDHQWLMLTLTVMNCAVTDLRANIKHMQSSFRKLRELKKWPALGYVKSLEVTKSEDGQAHPHFHILMLVPNDYFKDPNKYIRYDEWSKLWQQCLGVSYLPVVHIKALKARKNEKMLDVIGGTLGYETKEDGSLGVRIVEEKTSKVYDKINAAMSALEYETKVAAMIDDPAFIVEAAKQVARTRNIEVGGVLKKYLVDDKMEVEERKMEIGQLKHQYKAREVFFEWVRSIRRYVRKHKIALPRGSQSFRLKGIGYDEANDEDLQKEYGPPIKIDMVAEEGKNYSLYGSRKYLAYCKSYEDLKQIHKVRDYRIKFYAPVIYESNGQIRCEMIC